MCPQFPNMTKAAYKAALYNQTYSEAQPGGDWDEEDELDEYTTCD